MNKKETRKFFIQAGEPVAMIGGSDGRCGREGDALVVMPDELWGNPVYADASLDESDFHIHARLTLDGLAGNGASMLLGGHYRDDWSRPEGNRTFRVCLDEDIDPARKSLDKQMRIVHARTDPRTSWFPADGSFAKQTVGVCRDFFRPREPFTVDVYRRGEAFTFTINGREVFCACLSDERLISGGRNDAGWPISVGFLPGRGILRIHEFWATGRFPEPAFPTTDVWRLNSGGYSLYRTPSLCKTSDGRLLAFSEARRSYLSRGWEWEKNQGIEVLSGEFHCTMKRSDDNGKTWSDQQIVIDRGTTYDARDPSPLLDRDTGEIFLFTRGAWVLSSRDAGETWSGPRSLNGALPGNWKSGNWKSLIPGTANCAVQLHQGRFKGRLLAAFHGKSVIGLVFSDDHGKTWQPGALVPAYMAGEPSIVELADGRVIASPRLTDVPASGRRLLISHDGGSSFPETRTEPALPSSGPGQLLAVDLPNTSTRGTVRPIVFCGVAEDGARLTLNVSLDDGATWPISRVIDEGSAANLALVALPGGEIGVLYERDKCRRLSFQRVNLEEQVSTMIETRTRISK